jgi:hypothetical protein
MSEKMYSLLLRLYPAQFRKKYGSEALQLFRDRLRDEAGFLARLRLWFDLIADLAISIPREHRTLRPAMVTSTPAVRGDGMPSFRVMEEEPPRPGTLMMAGVLSAAGLVTFFLLLSIAGARFISRKTQTQTSPATVESSAPAAPTADATAGGGNPANAAATAAAAGNQSARAASAGQSISLATLDPAERHRVVVAVADDLTRFYFDRDKAQQAAAAVLREEEHGGDDQAATGSALAVLLTRQIRSVTDDRHLIVEYSATPLPDHPVAALSGEAFARYRALMLHDHCTIERAAILPGNLGYIRLNAFPDPAVCASQVQTAMHSINNARAVIFDLRDNRGGDPAMVALIAEYLFARPQYWYSPRGTEPWLASPVAGSHLANKPVYVLTSAVTISGAEQFSYDLKMLHRATIVGETTAGSAHAGVFHRIGDHFGIGIPEFRVVNPYSDHDWEVVGVTPDVRVQPADALAATEKLAETKLTASTFRR